MESERFGIRPAAQGDAGAIDALAGILGYTVALVGCEGYIDD